MLLGLHLACGLNTGEIIFLDPVTIQILTETPFKDTKFPIKEMNYSLDSLTMAFSVSVQYLVRRRRHMQAAVISIVYCVFLGYRQNGGRVQI